MAIINDKVLKYEEFLNEKLRTDLRGVHEERDQIYKQISDYMQLKRLIETIKDSACGDKGTINSNNNIPPPCNIKMKMDLGCNFYCQTVIPDCSRVFVMVGFGYYVEMTLHEAEIFIDKKIKILNQKSQRCSKDSEKIKAHIKLVMAGLRELQSLNQEPTKPKIDVFL